MIIFKEIPFPCTFELDGQTFTSKNICHIFELPHKRKHFLSIIEYFVNGDQSIGRFKPINCAEGENEAALSDQKND